VIEELNQLVIEISDKQPVAIVVDDLHRIDEPSFAFLASLSTLVGNNRISMMVSIESGAKTNAPLAMELLSKSAKRLRLEALSEEDSRTLLSSIFGEVPNLGVLNLLAYQSHAGNPSELMDLAHTLVDRELVRYEGGGWLISDNFEALGQAAARRVDIQSRLSALSADAVALISLIALDRDQLMELDDYVELSDHADRSRIHKALDELVQARLLYSFGVHYRFMHQDQQKQIVDNLTDERRRELHLRLAERLTTKQKNPIYQAYHFLLAGTPSRAKEPMRRFSEFAEKNAGADILRSPIIFETVESAIEAAERKVGRLSILPCIERGSS